MKRAKQEHKQNSDFGYNENCLKPWQKIDKFSQKVIKTTQREKHKIKATHCNIYIYMKIQGKQGDL